MIHVALLRGINVGGNNKVPMADLRRLCEGIGWTAVTTYINSGNVVFRAPEGDHAAMGAALAGALEAEFGFGCRVLVKAGEDVAAIAAAIPAAWANDASLKSDVVYLLDGLDPLEIIAALQPRDGIDTALHAPGAVLWMVQRRDAARSGLQRITASPLYQQVTVRNVNTARKLAGLVGEVRGGGGIRTHGRG